MCVNACVSLCVGVCVRLCLILCLILHCVTQDTPDKILRYVVRQFAKVLPSNPAGKKAFLSSRGLARVLELKSDSKASLRVCMFVC